MTCQLQPAESGLRSYGTHSRPLTRACSTASCRHLKWAQCRIHPSPQSTRRWSAGSRASSSDRCKPAWDALVMLGHRLLWRAWWGSCQTKGQMTEPAGCSGALGDSASQVNAQSAQAAWNDDCAGATRQRQFAPDLCNFNSDGNIACGVSWGQTGRGC